MAPEQRDYGTSDSTLVPGTLTVFRHFQADLRSGVLTPMNYNPKWAARHGAPRTPGHQPYTRPMGNLTAGWPDGEPRELEQPTYRAECNKLYQVAWDCYPSEHRSPSKDCTCGFYASYDPATDFYPSFRWGRAYARLAGAEDYEDFAVVKAAVEVSGTVVMGRLGVRAEKMKILGIAIDWDKRIRERDAANSLGSWARDPYFGMGVQSQHRYVAYNPSTGEYEMRQVEVEEDDDAETIAQAHNLANHYGATYHGSVADLVKAYPKADVSALGIDEAPPEAEPDSWGAFRLQLNQPNHYVLAQQQALYAQKALQQAGNSFKDMAKALNDVLGVDIFPATPKQKKWRPGGTMPDHARRALEAKQNRKPPPGSGIDRRKRKL